jgi:hypothetical protein
MRRTRAREREPARTRARASERALTPRAPPTRQRFEFPVTEAQVLGWRVAQDARKAASAATLAKSGSATSK